MGTNAEILNGTTLIAILIGKVPLLETCDQMCPYGRYYDYVLCRMFVILVMLIQIREGDVSEPKQRTNSGRVANVGYLGPTNCGRFYTLYDIS